MHARPGLQAVALSQGAPATPLPSPVKGGHWDSVLKKMQIASSAQSLRSSGLQRSLSHSAGSSPVSVPVDVLVPSVPVDVLVSSAASSGCVAHAPSNRTRLNEM